MVKVLCFLLFLMSNFVFLSPCRKRRSGASCYEIYKKAKSGDFDSFMKGKISDIYDRESSFSNEFIPSVLGISGLAVDVKKAKMIAIENGDNRAVASLSDWFNSLSDIFTENESLWISREKALEKEGFSCGFSSFDLSDDMRIMHTKNTVMDVFLFCCKNKLEKARKYLIKNDIKESIFPFSHKIPFRNLVCDFFSDIFKNGVSQTEAKHLFKFMFNGIKGVSAGKSIISHISKIIEDSELFDIVGKSVRGNGNISKHMKSKKNGILESFPLNLIIVG